MAYTTAGCVSLLNTDPSTQGTNQGPWKRQSKRKGPLVVERVFSDKVGQRFALVVETAEGLKFDGDAKACIQALVEAGFRWDARVQAMSYNPEETARVTDWMAQGMAGGQAQLQEVRESAVAVDTFPRLTHLFALQALLDKPGRSLLALTMDPSHITDPSFWGQLHKMEVACELDIYLIPTDSPLAQIQEQVDGPLERGQWRKAIFIQGRRLGKDLEDMLTGGFDELIQRCSQAPSHPKPR